MSGALDNYSYRELQFAKDGSAVDPNQATAVGELAAQVSDLIVLSHGWNNDMDEARSLYEQIAGSFDAVRSGGHAPKLDGRSIGIVGVLWPSKRFADSDLIPGGAASIEHSDPTLPADLLAMSDAFDTAHAKATLAKAAALVPDLDHSPSAQREYADLLRSLISKKGAEPADAIDQFFRLDGEELMQRLDAASIDATVDLPPIGGAGAAAQGGAQAIPAGGLGGSGLGAAAGFSLGSLWSKGRMLLNCVTYYEMKARAGSIGAGSVGPILAQQVVGRTRLHVVGHSFGARLVTAAANSLSQPGAVSSVNLLQAAFSHNSFAKDWQPGSDGAYRHLVTSGVVAGPAIVTHTRNDTAVGLAYAIASRIAGQNDSAIGDQDSPYGGLGSNGAQHTPEALNDQDLADVDNTYTFQTGKVHNLLADKYISGHSDITGVQVANAVLQSVAATV
jgi:hypothetical protein